MSVGSVNSSVHSLVGRRPSTTDVNQNKKIRNQGEKITNQGKKITDQAKKIDDLNKKIAALEKGDAGKSADDTKTPSDSGDSSSGSGLDSKSQDQVDSLSKMEAQNNAMNMAMFGLQQKAQSDEHLYEGESQISRTGADTIQNTEKNIR